MKFTQTEHFFIGENTYHVAFSPNRKFMAVCLDECMILYKNKSDTFSWLDKSIVVTYPDPCYIACFIDDDQLIIYGEYGLEKFIISQNKYAAFSETIHNHYILSQIKSIIVNKSLLYITYGTEIACWNLETGKGENIIDFAPNIPSVSTFIAESRLLVSQNNGQIYKVDVLAGKTEQLLDLAINLSSVSIIPNSESFIYTIDHSVNAWLCENNVSKPIISHDNFVYFAVIVDDYLVTVGKDGMFIWRIEL